MLLAGWWVRVVLAKSCTTRAVLVNPWRVPLKSEVAPRGGTRSLDCLREIGIRHKVSVRGLFIIPPGYEANRGTVERFANPAILLAGAHVLC